MAGVKAGQSTGRKNRSIDDLLLGVILPLLILAIAVAALYIILVFGYLLGRRLKEGAD